MISTPCIEKLKHLKKNCHCNQTGLINQRTSENIGEKWKHFYSQENDNQFCRSNSYSHWPKKLFLQFHPFLSWMIDIFLNNIGRLYLMLFKYLSRILSNLAKAHSLCKQCLHDLHFLKKRSYSPNLSKLARADISCHFMKTRSLCRTVYKMNGF